MKPTLLLLMLWTVGIVHHPAFCQLDTIYYDDFVDLRHSWKAASTEANTTVVRDGFLEVKVRQPKGSYRLSSFEAPVMGSDSVVYQIRIVPDSVHTVGPAYFINYLKARKDGSRPICCYQALVASPKGVHAYEYSRDNRGAAFTWAPKNIELDSDDITFRLTYGPSGKLNYYWNDQLIRSSKARISKRHSLWQNWGFVSRGNADFKVDYVLVMASKKP